MHPSTRRGLGDYPCGAGALCPGTSGSARLGPGMSNPVTEPAMVRPRPVSAADRQAFDAMVDDALGRVRAAVVAWRTGLTGLITLITTGIILTGRKTTTDLTVPWRIAVTLTIGGGLVLAIAGLWHALAAEAGSRTRLRSLQDIRKDYGSVQAYQVGLAAAAGRRLQTARIFVAAALGLLLTGVLLTWWAPAAPAKPPAYLKVARMNGTVCGVLVSADGGVIRLEVPGIHDPVVIPLTAVTNMAVTSACT